MSTVPNDRTYNDRTFFERADAHISLANAQTANIPAPRVSASITFATARFNAWLCANMYGSAAEMQAKRDDAIRQLTEHYNKMLGDSFDDFIQNYDRYKNGPANHG